MSSAIDFVNNRNSKEIRSSNLEAKIDAVKGTLGNLIPISYDDSVQPNQIVSVETVITTDKTLTGFTDTSANTFNTTNLGVKKVNYFSRLWVKRWEMPSLTYNALYAQDSSKVLDKVQNLDNDLVRNYYTELKDLALCGDDNYFLGLLNQKTYGSEKDLVKIPDNSMAVFKTKASKNFADIQDYESFYKELLSFQQIVTSSKDLDADFTDIVVPASIAYVMKKVFIKNTTTSVFDYIFDALYPTVEVHVLNDSYFAKAKVDKKAIVFYNKNDLSVVTTTPKASGVEEDKYRSTMWAELQASTVGLVLTNATNIAYLQVEL